VREHSEHAGNAQCLARIDMLDAALAMLEVTTAACARPRVLYSAAYFAAPVTFARPSMRDVGVPI